MWGLRRSRDAVQRARAIREHLLLADLREVHRRSQLLHSIVVLARSEGGEAATT